MFKHKKNETPPSPRSPGLKIFIENENGERLVGWASIDYDQKKQEIFVGKFGALFGPLTHAGFNLNIYNVEGYQDKWIPIETEQDFDQDLHIKLQPKAPPKPEYPRRTGVVTNINRVPVDTQGAENFLGISMFWAINGYYNTKDQLDRDLDYLANKNIQYIRVLCEVGSENPNDSWYYRRMNPAVIDYFEFFKYVFTKYGIRINPCVFGDRLYSSTPDLRSRTVSKILSAIRQIPEAIIYYQTVNEQNYDSLQEIRDLTFFAQSQIPNLISPGSPAGWQDTVNELYGNNCGSVLAMHGERTDFERMWKYVRTPYSFRELNGTFSVKCNEEGQGQGSSLVADDDPLRQAFYALTGYIAGTALHTIHCRYGTRGGDPYDTKHYGPWKSYQESPGVADTIDMINYAKKFIPKDVSNYSVWNGNHSEHLLPADLVWADDDSYDHGVLRTYMAKNGNNFVMLPYSIFNYSIHKAQVPMNIKVHDLYKKEVVIDKSLAPGETVALVNMKGSESYDYGYLVIGSY